MVSASSPEAVHFSYRRFVVNQLRKRFGYDGVPIRVFYKAKRARKPRQAELPKEERQRPVRHGQRRLKG